MKSKIYAIDFDGFLCKDKYPEIGEPKYDNITYVKDLKNDGHIIILWTCREDKLLNEAIDWCKQNGIVFDYVNENTSENIKKYGGNSRKIFADYYLDDRGIYIHDDNYTENKKGEIMKDNENSDPISINEVSNSFSESNKQYNIINNPSHYIKGRKFEPAWVINDWGLSWDLGTCVKYIARLGRKDDKSQDIKKAFWYLVHEIALHNKNIYKEELFETINTIYSEEENYEKNRKNV